MNEIIKEPNPILHEVSEQVKLPLSKEDKQLIDEMYSWLKEHNDTAVGLSAVQIGVLKRMCVIRIDIGGTIHGYKLVNPKIVRHSFQKRYLEEGCLSVEEQYHNLVPRYDEVMVVAYDAIQNKNITINTSGWFARVLQHEIDHMDGILFTDRMEK